MSYILITITLLLSGDYNSLRKAAIAEYEAGHYLRAEALIRTALESARAANDEYAEGLSHSHLGDALQSENRLLDAAREYREALAIFTQSGSSHAAAIVWRNLASNLTARGQYREAHRALNAAMKLVAQNRIHDDALNSEIANGLGMIQFNEGNIGRAANSFKRAAAFTSAGTWQVRNNLGHIYQFKHEYLKAECEYQASLRLIEARFGPGHPSAAFVRNNLGALYFDWLRYNDAAIQFEQSLAVLERADTSFDETVVMHTLYELARTRVAQNDEARAQPLLARASAIARRHAASLENAETAEIFAMYSRVLKNESNLAESEHADADARRVRATMAFTVPLAKLK